jgi:hypothetical protein
MEVVRNCYPAIRSRFKSVRAGQCCSQVHEMTSGFKTPSFSKGCGGTVEDVIQAYRCRDAEERILVLRRELDRELDKLAEAMRENNAHNMDQCKARLKEIRREMLLLEAL